MVPENAQRQYGVFVGYLLTFQVASVPVKCGVLLRSIDPDVRWWKAIN